MEFRIDEYKVFIAEKCDNAISWVASPAPEADLGFKSWVEKYESRGFEIREVTDRFEKLELMIAGILNECMYTYDHDLSNETVAAIRDTVRILRGMKGQK